MNSDTRKAGRKGGMRRFTIHAYGQIRYLTHCDLDARKIWRLTEFVEPQSPYRPLEYSNNLDERVVFSLVYGRRDASPHCDVLNLSSKKAALLEHLLTSEAVESMRGITNQTMGERSSYLNYRDGWSIDFYAEGDENAEPLLLEHISFGSIVGAELPFEKIETICQSWFM